MSKLKEHNGCNKEGPISVSATQTNDAHLPYSPPRVLSAEQLEAAAFACNPPTGGKSSTDGCGINPTAPPLGS